MNREYEINGYFVVKNLFNEDEITALRDVLLDFHDSWQAHNERFYAEKALNSAYITGTEYLAQPQRLTLFQFIGANKLMNMVTDVLGDKACFMNTQLFFNPQNKQQKNYWHRDPQYHLSLAQQQEALTGTEVIHCRIPLFNEPGIELVPGSHKRWDSSEELAVRLGLNQSKNYQNLSSGVTVELSAGDLLVFSANMIHRGLYGMDRLSLDVLFCQPEPDLVKFVKSDCLPSQPVINALENGSAFANTIALQAQ